jgi:peptidoglycan glycosyltransferase
MILLLLFQLDKLRPENLFGGQVLERTPAGLSIIYLIGMAVLIGFLIMSFWGNFSRPKFTFEQNLPREVVKKLTLTLANRSLRIWQIFFILLTFMVYGFHVYWTYYADDYNEQYQSLSYKDLRNRRTSASTLRGWMLDRTGKLSNALAYYKVDKDGTIDRTFPLEKEMAHLLGTERGTPGLERTLYKKEADPMPESWEILTKYKKPEPENKDVRITIDKELQTFIAQQMDAELAKGRKGAMVVINPQNGDVLGIYSTPTYSLSEAESLSGYLKLEANKMDQPLLSRALRQYYIPGSTFKTLTMMAAFRDGKENAEFPDRPSSSEPPCYLPFKGSKPICDAGGSCDLCTESANMRDAFQVSSNQYFAQLGNYLGRDKMAETGRLVGIDPVETPEDARQLKYFPDIWNTSNKRIANAISPAQSMMVTGKKLTLYDFGIVSYGQGLAGQMTPFQMALIAAGAGNLEGKLMKPKIEADLPPQMFSQLLTPQQGIDIREIMSTVTEEGTAKIIKQKLAGTGIRTGGKTGTADKDNTPLYNSDGTRKTHKEKKKNDKGEIVDVDVPDTFTRWDGWFICIAPLENPQVAIAIVLENIGNGRFGGDTAAPVAAQVLLKARDLGLLGDQYKPKAQTPTKKKG